MNLYYLILIRVIIVGFHLWWFLKFMNFKTHDKQLKFRFDGISWIRLIVMTVLNLSLFMPAAKMSVLYGFIVGNGMILITFIQLRSIMVFGDRYLYFKDSGFEMRDVDRFKMDGIRLSMRMKGQAISFLRPITHIQYGEERFSGRRRKRR